MYSRHKRTMENYETIYTGKANDVIPVLKYKSKATGMTVVIAQVEGPLVNGYFCLATEAFDDDGLPHTLEHLVFMGSEKYPYKGVLDLLANRCLASGTNAWTDTDHTCYTMTTAGSEGFLNLLPIYLDHVLYPTITEGSYVTEVHHVNGEGEDAGVVYCEMQARENTGESRTHLEMLRAMYPGHCGYKSETGGIMANLRESCSHKKVCDYHKEFYRPDNLCLVITGQVQPEEVFQALMPFEDKIKSKGPLPPYQRPWQNPVPALPETVEKLIRYGCDDEESGIVAVAWRGPKAKEQYKIHSLMLVLEYLTDTAVAPVERDFVEIDDPYCSSVSYHIIENSESCISFNFQNVQMDKLKEVKPKLMELLEKIANKEEKLDMKRMKNLIHKKMLETLSSLEDQPHDTMAFSIIGDFLYGQTVEDMAERMNEVKSFKKMLDETEDYWTSLLKTYMVGAKSVTILGEPSIELMEEMGKTEEQRVEKQRAALGDKGLEEKGKALEKATQENETEPPEEMLTSVPIPNVNSIHFHTITPYNNGDQADGSGHEKFAMNKIPVTFYLDDIQTNFITMTAMMNTSMVPEDLKMYLPLFHEVISESPVKRNGVLVSHEEIISELSGDTVENSTGQGIGGGRFVCGNYQELALLELKVELEKYKKGIQWIKELLFQTQFTAERLKIVGQKMNNEVAGDKRSGKKIVRMILMAMMFKKESLHYSSNMLRQNTFLTDLLKKLEKKETAEEVIAKFEKLRGIITQPCNLKIHIAANVESLAKMGAPNTPWEVDLLPENLSKSGNKPTLKQDHEYRTKEIINGGQGCIAGVGSVETAFMLQVAPSLASFTHDDLPAIMVYIQYLTQLEGPMWRQIRGLGLAYHYSMYIKPETGMLYFLLFKSTHVVNAYKVGKQIVSDLLSGKTAFNNVELESCKSSLIFEIIEEEKTPSDASEQSLLSYFRGVGKDYNKTIIQKIPKVTVDDLKRVGEQYIAALFDVEKSSCAIVVHPTKVKEVCEGFKEQGRELQVIEDLDTSPMFKL